MCRSVDCREGVGGMDQAGGDATYLPLEYRAGCLSSRVEATVECRTGRLSGRVEATVEC